MRNNALYFINKANPYEAGTHGHEQFKLTILKRLEDYADAEYRSAEEKRGLSPEERKLFAQKSFEKAIEKNRETSNTRLNEQNIRFLLGIYPHFKALEAAYKAANESAMDSTFKVALFTHV